MDFVVVFFRDILDGPLYIVVVIINSILICACLGYLADNYLKKKKAEEDYNNTYATVTNSTAGISPATNTQQQVQQTQPQAAQTAGQPTQMQK